MMARVDVGRDVQIAEDLPFLMGSVEVAVPCINRIERFIMGKSKTNMPSEFKLQCGIAIHTASAAAVAAGAIPIPIADTIPISATQVAMIVALGKIFDLTISESAAKSIIGIGVAQSVGRTIVSGLKAIPGVGTIVGITISAATAGTLTEALGWLVADDFYRISRGETPENITAAARDLIDFKENNF